MQLAEYLDVHRIRIVDFAAKVGISAPSVSKIANGINKPSFETMQKIYDATNGEVTVHDFWRQHPVASASAS